MITIISLIDKLRPLPKFATKRPRTRKAESAKITSPERQAAEAREAGKKNCQLSESPDDKIEEEAKI